MMGMNKERDRAQTIVQAYGCSSLARFTLFNDKSYYFSQGGSMIAYVVKGRIALALGDPIGPQEDIQASLAGFQDLCASNDWQPAFYQTLPDHLDLYRHFGYEILCIGQEAIVDLTEFTLSGKSSKSFRYPYNRLKRLGYKVELYQPPLDENLLNELHSISDEWLTMVHGTEMAFSLGWFDDDYVKGCQVMVVYSPQGKIVAFANLNSEYRLNEITIDLMRHRKGIENGTMELLFVSLFQWAREQGYDGFNLGLSALYGVGEHAGDPIVERAEYFIYQHIDRFYNFKGLHAFKQQFNPRWSPRYLVFQNPSSLPAVVVAILRADSGDSLPRGFAQALPSDRRLKLRSANQEKLEMVKPSLMPHLNIRRKLERQNTETGNLINFDGIPDTIKGDNNG